MTSSDSSVTPKVATSQASSKEAESKKLLHRVAEAARCILHGRAAVASVAVNGRDSIIVSAGLDPGLPPNPEALVDVLERAGGSGEGNEAVLAVADVAQESREVIAAGLRAVELTAFLAVPLLSANERIGALGVGDTAVREWSADDTDTLRELAALAELLLDKANESGPQNEERDRMLAQLRRGFDDGLAGHAVATPNGRILACNPEFARIAGFNSVAEAMSANLRELEPEPGAFAALLERLQELHLIPLEELNFVRRDGTPEQVLARLAATIDSDGKVSEIRAYLVDITQHFLLEQDARNSAERLMLLEMATQDVLWDWNLATGRVSWNNAAARRFRYNTDEVRASIDWHMDRIHADDRDRVLSGIERAIQGVDNFWTAEYRFLRGDGSYAVILDRAYIVRNGRGEPKRVVGWIFDITERKAREESLRFLARAGAALDSALEIDATAATLARLGVPTVADVCMVDLLDHDGSLRRCAVSHAEPGREQFLGLGNVVALDSQDTDAPLAAVRSGAPDFLSISDFDASHNLGVSSQAGVRAYMVVPISARGHVLGAATFGYTDARRHFDPYNLMTAKELAQLAGQAIDNAILYETVRRAMSARNEMLGVVSHDLRTPVNTMMATLSILSDSMNERREEVRKWFDMAYRATEQMKALIEDLLDTSRIESQQFTVERSDGNAFAIITEACEMLRPLAAARNISIDCVATEDLPDISVDVQQVVRVLANLVGNGIKFSQPGGRIQVSAQALDSELRMSVHDDGQGIPEDQLARVFDQFWTGRSGNRRGAGLGLAIAKGIVEAHGGHIWVESQEDVGSTFTFSLPLKPNLNEVPQTRMASPLATTSNPAR